ncbi:L-threonylcarbamoyladenylate synthase [Alkalilimnicola ehrlichii MLHE-1]|uniref:Threonylcarbamoyl-AMP synthase n=1 Tax=Alkalilimnicola ehrlichii (strain ATCC BAA-1101 / DSM 17681 / MLHE-1) TaxID=187272 RepID=TSAC_ALKEH|nr:Sua5/YciO/YrdC/YwlC family protein [Alkalilimnicola ehrlichii]Q0A5B4.1 RecName: Full=Threonylcarbamoyl-AMP synthase; Short=TC-AMP synthase; AltName: Full=L-threonylcarbamoyladenylate synthase; AltName: Full=t(6)A37 threonylcarbamoyladenosine biosynthesis protein TsaC; AltName: Full=tRNA threonylcarbamoyladenosine biosynthesis protein TsaC [Alkalilimnicola ehrlichii MLHE-1]ABI57973.1 translation factor SUA5 [Alkalilimnicola ehrlichii MLHE-1]
MPTETTPRFRIRQCAARLQAGGVVAYPTEAVYGLGCDPGDPAAVATLLTLKRRDPGKGLILIASRVSQLSPWLGDAPLPQAVLASWPGPNTWLLPAAPHTPAWITGGRAKVAVRVTAHPVAAALCEAFGGAIVSTSANRDGQPPARSATQVRTRLGAEAAELADILPGPVDRSARPTAIRDAESGAVIRA